MKQATVNLFADMGAQPGTLQSGLVAAHAVHRRRWRRPRRSRRPRRRRVVRRRHADHHHRHGGRRRRRHCRGRRGVDRRRRHLDPARPARRAGRSAGPSAAPARPTIKSRALRRQRQHGDAVGWRRRSRSPRPDLPVQHLERRSTVPPAPLDDRRPERRWSSARSSAPTSTASSPAFVSTRQPPTPARTPARLWTQHGQRCSPPSRSPARRRRAGSRRLFPNAGPDHREHDLRVSYHAPVGHYTGTDAFFATGVDRPPLHALRDGTDGANGVYATGTATTFPTNTWQRRELLGRRGLHHDAAADTTAPTITAEVPGGRRDQRRSGDAGHRDVQRGDGPRHDDDRVVGKAGRRRDRSSCAIRRTTWSRQRSPTTRRRRSRRFVPRVSSALSTTYTAIVKGGTTDPRVKDVAGNAMAANATWTFTTAAAPPPPSSCPCTHLVADDGARSRSTTAIRARSCSARGSGPTFPATSPVRASTRAR